VERPGRAQRPSVEERGETVDARPVVSALDEVIDDGIGRGVDQLVKDRFAADEAETQVCSDAQKFSQRPRRAFWLRARSL
jgi:hypothetical protein